MSLANNGCKSQGHNYPYGLPHPADRLGQRDAIEWCIDLEGVGIVEGKTGSGKTSFAAGTASRKRVIATCATKNLQQENYGDGYSFDILYGKNNACYECVYTDVLPGTNPSNCQYSNKLHKCPKSHKCTYQVQKHICQSSQKTSLNNAYYLSAMWPKESPPDVLFLDEAHELHSFVTRWAGCTIGIKEQLEWSLPAFPVIMHLTPNTLLRLGPPVDLAVPWLIRARAIMRRHYHGVKSASTDSKADRERLQRCENLGRKLGNTLDALRLHRSDWYVRSGPEAREYRGKVEPGFICKPLTARHHFSDYFLSGAKNVIMMSATIGNQESFTEELGLSDYSSLVIPSQYPPSVQPIELLDCPAMGARADETALQHQAEQIASFIKDCPQEWSGLVLVTSKYRANDLVRRLSALNLQDRVWITPGADGHYMPTDAQAAAWDKRKLEVPNSICISWAFWTGFDGLDEQFCVIAKAPFLLYGSSGSYAEAWRLYSHSRYLWVAACILAQGCGRTRRGRAEDYNLNGKVNGRVAIADASWSQLRSYLPQITLDSIVE